MRQTDAARTSLTSTPFGWQHAACSRGLRRTCPALAPGTALSDKPAVTFCLSIDAPPLPFSAQGRVRPSPLPQHGGSAVSGEFSMSPPPPPMPKRKTPNRRAAAAAPAGALQNPNEELWQEWAKEKAAARRAGAQKAAQVRLARALASRLASCSSGPKGQHQWDATSQAAGNSTELPVMGGNLDYI